MQLEEYFYFEYYCFVASTHYHVQTFTHRHTFLGLVNVSAVPLMINIFMRSFNTLQQAENDLIKGGFLPN